MSGAALGPTQPPVQLVLREGGLSLEVKWPGREANHSPPFTAEVKEYVELYFHSQYVFMAWCFVKHRDNFTFNELFQLTSFYGMEWRREDNHGE
jgi:hypothetical protein